jgi:hypothetical protein
MVGPTTILTTPTMRPTTAVSVVQRLRNHGCAPQKIRLRRPLRNEHEVLRNRRAHPIAHSRMRKSAVRLRNRQSLRNRPAPADS